MSDISAPGDTADAWLRAAYDALTDGGVDAVKIMALAKTVGVTRSGFYWHFKDRGALLEAMIARWERTNTGNLVARCDAYAETICEAVLNLVDCWLDDALFDGRLDLAIRNWARTDPALAARLNRADAQRQAAIEAMFRRFGYAREDAEIRTLTMIYTQIGYISMHVAEDRTTRLSRMRGYLEVFTGCTPTASELDRFMARHDASGPGPAR